jgi:transcriptional regulator with XRE-family HTH domain
MRQCLDRDSEAEKSMDQSPAEPGVALRSLREENGWTLAEVSKKTGLPISTLSRIENNRMSLNFDKLMRLSSALGVDMAQLLNPARLSDSATPRSGRRSVTRAGGGRLVETTHYKYHYQATDLLNKQFVPIIAEVRARSLAEFGELIRHPGEEFALVMEGAVEVHTDIYEPLRLDVGDSVYFDSTMGHAYVAAAAGTCRILSVSSSSAGPDTVLAQAAKGAQGHRDTRPAPAKVRRRGRNK